jgi:tripartite-type tricarboxylate transporter receptor subunit TctC
MPLLLLLSASATQCAELQSFYEGKTITMLTSTTPGSATDVAGRLAARHLGKYIPGIPHIVAQNMPGAGGIVSANYLFNLASPMGLPS